MKSIYMKVIIAGVILATIGLGCTKLLDERVYSKISSESVLSTEAGISSVLTSAYNKSELNGSEYWFYFFSAMTSGEARNVGGSVSAELTPLTDFTWDSNLDWFEDAWKTLYAGIRDANVVLDHIDNKNFSDAFKQEMTGEAKFVRGICYVYLYKWFGPTPLYLTSSTDSIYLARPTEARIVSQIEQDLTDAANDLPVDQATYGRATKGAALGLLCKFYLNQKQWQKCADIASQVIGLNKYGLVPSYHDLFDPGNEKNEEMIWVMPCSPKDHSNQINALTFPVDFPLPYANDAVFAACSYFSDDFVHSFEPGDTRKDLIVTSYTNTSGTFIQLLGNDQSMPLKYEWDPNASGQDAGNDIPVVRYADVLLSRAEALNELNGPTEESIDLINQVRTRAGVSPLSLGAFTKATLRDHIFQERNWEFYYEMMRREDQIRQGTFISGARARGKNAQEFQQLFPIPQPEIDVDPNLKQNEGY